MNMKKFVSFAILGLCCFNAEAGFRSSLKKAAGGAYGAAKGAAKGATKVASSAANVAYQGASYAGHGIYNAGRSAINSQAGQNAISQAKQAATEAGNVAYNSAKQTWDEGNYKNRVFDPNKVSQVVTGVAQYTTTGDSSGLKNTANNFYGRAKDAAHTGYVTGVSNVTGAVGSHVTGKINGMSGYSNEGMHQPSAPPMPKTGSDVY
ncbi:hypothetical protein [Candidatus Nesciobacter abundans]|uniref:Uncharacterized protein n=1 Tax=Candidatus Nesciobacter abundans TaxID=2601668 RepID=A0A5C0UJV6_9PROT|nr:hypothetical protein [Candidatus Nesciobacter abundans]QEK39114.1 hypothetical protein FZC36_01525 [Candidatus Nesciobacter abundans]